jgi:hypothetical protein
LIRVFRVPLTRERLLELPQAERSLLFLFGYAFNQISMLSRLTIFSSNKDPVHEIDQRLSGAQTQMLARLTLGTLHEAWKLIEERFLKTPIGREYVPLLDQKGKDALETIKTNLKGSNLLRKLRNDFAFHYPEDADVQKGFEAALTHPDFNDQWNWYFSDALMNSFFFASDLVILHGMTNATGEPDLIQAHIKVMDEVRLNREPMLEFILAFIGALWKHRFGLEMDVVELLPILDAARWDSIWIPFYAEY